MRDTTSKKRKIFDFNNMPQNFRPRKAIELLRKYKLLSKNIKYWNSILVLGSYNLKYNIVNGISASISW